MWQSAIYNYLPVRTVSGVEIVILQDKSFLLNAVIVKQQKGKLIKAEEYIHIASLSALIEKLPKGIPVGINISGRGILHKTLPDKTGTNLLESVIPGARQEDYYYQQFICNEKNEIAVIRREQLDDIVQQFIKEGVIVLRVGLSLCFSSRLSHIIKTGSGESIQTSAWQIQLRDGKLVEYLISPVTEKPLMGPELLIGDQSVRHNLLAAFAAATEVILDNPSEAGLCQGDISRQKEIFHYRRLFNTVGISSLVVLLVVLLINVFIYQHYYSLAQEAQANNQLYQKKLNNLDTLLLRVNQKEKFLATIGWIKQPVMSEISDKIGASVPKDVILTQLAIFPEENVKGTDRMPRFRQDTVKLQGDCNVPWILNSWIAAMQQIDIVQSAKLESYWYKKEDETGHFQIELTLK